MTVPIFRLIAPRLSLFHLLRKMSDDMHISQEGTGLHLNDNAKIVISGGTECCYHDANLQCQHCRHWWLRRLNRRCHQWRQSRHHDDSWLSVFVPYMNHSCNARYPREFPVYRSVIWQITLQRRCRSWHLPKEPVRFASDMMAIPCKIYVVFIL